MPSYAFLDRLKTAWGGPGGLLDKFNAKKQIFYEPQTAGEVDTVLRDYAMAIETAKEKRTGALMFAVVGGKLSEGKLCSFSLSTDTQASTSQTGSVGASSWWGCRSRTPRVPSSQRG